jgi:asparagine synthase (glutamine-hydrolysing)
MSLAGCVFKKSEGHTAKQAMSMLAAQCHQPLGAISFIADNVFHKVNSLADLEAVDLGANKIFLGQVSFATGEKEAEVPYFNSKIGLSLIYEGELYNYDELAEKVKHHLNTKNASEAVLYLLQEHYQGDLKAILGQIAKDLDGAYALAASNGTDIVLLRDPVGMRPVYVAEDNYHLCFASEKKALWEIGMRNVKPLRGGELAILGADGIKIERNSSLKYISHSGEKTASLSDALTRYKKTLYEAVEKRLKLVNKIGVLLSGGVDSSLVAKITHEIAEREGIKIVCYSAGVTGSPDLEYAEGFAQELSLQLKTRRLDINAVESYIPIMVQAVEERDFVQVEAGIGVFAAMEMAKQDGMEIIFSGQGADELWGGYVWDPEIIKEKGYEEFVRREWEDIGRADIETLDRENKLASWLGLEASFPYLDLGVIKLAANVAPQLKVRSPRDKLGKYVHRRLAEVLGIPSRYAYRHKDAAQHGSGIHAVLDKIARRNGFTPEMVARLGYAPEEIAKEKLSSSGRYGYKYSDRELWIVPPHVQLYFDILAYKLGLLNQAERDKIEHFALQALACKDI